MVWSPFVSKFQSFSRQVSQASCNRQTDKQTNRQTDYCNPPAHARWGLIITACKKVLNNQMPTSTQNEGELWDQAQAVHRKWSSQKGKRQRRRSTSGNGLTRGSNSLWLWHAGYALKWTIKASHLCLRFGGLFVGSTRLEYAGPKTSSGHGPIVQATIKRATSPTMPTVSHTKWPWCNCVLSHVIVYTVRYYCTMYQWNVSGQHSVMAGQITVWSDRVQAVMK